MKTTAKNIALGLDIRTSKFEPSDYISWSLDPIVRLLRGFTRVYLVVRPPYEMPLADRRKAAKSWKDGIAKWRQATRPGFTVKVIYDVTNLGDGPCRDWALGIRFAMEDGVQRIVYLPCVDAAEIQPEASRNALLQQFVDAAIADDADLVLGNYEAYTRVPTKNEKDVICFVPQYAARGEERHDIRKRLLEQSAIAAMVAEFPQAMNSFFELRADSQHDPHPRTGFFGCSRPLLEDFAFYRGAMNPLAGSMQLLLHVLVRNLAEENKFTIREHFVGGMEQDEEKLDHVSMAIQRLRDVFVVQWERAYWNWKCPGLAL